MRDLFNSKFRVTQEFGVNKEYYSRFSLSGHEGLDAVPTGGVWTVFCLADGVIVKDENNLLSGVYGNNVTVWHPSINKATQYCHMSENYVNLGDKVAQGQKVGRMGSSGNTNGAHVHLNLFEVDDNGTRLNRNNGFNGGINPLPFLNEDVQPVNTTALEECKTQVADEIKKKNETYAELVDTRTERDGLKQQAATYKTTIDDIATLLGTSSDLISQRIGEIMAVEDNQQVLLKRAEAAEQKFAQLQSTVEPMATDNAELRKLIETAKDTNKVISETLKETVDELDKYRKNGELKVIGRFFNIYFCVKGN